MLQFRRCLYARDGCLRGFILLVWEKKRALLHKFTTRVVKIAVGFRCKERKSAVFFVTLRHLSARLVVLGA